MEITKQNPLDLHKTNSMSLVNFFKSVGEPWEKWDEMDRNTIHEQFR